MEFFVYYPVAIEKDGHGYIASFPDIPEALTGGDTYEETFAAARDALVTAFEFYFEDHRTVPPPSPSESRPVVAVPASVWAKVLLLNELLNQHVSQSELARRMGKKKQEIQRIINLGHSTKIDTLEVAMSALGKQLMIAIK